MAIILFIFGAIASIIMTRQVGLAQSEQLGQLLKSIEHNPTAWKGIEIGGTEPLYFYKDLWITSNMVRRFPFWSTAFFSLLTLLLLATLLYEKQRTRKTKCEQLKYPYTSNELFHFVGHSGPNDDKTNYETLLKILDAECVSYPPHKNDWGEIGYAVNIEKSLVDGELIKSKATCYADIPFDCLSIHIKKYGCFGLSFPRDLLIKYGTRPVIYVPQRTDDWMSPYGTTLVKGIETVYKAFDELVVSKYSPDDGTYIMHSGKKPSNEHEAIDAMDRVFTKDFLAFIKPFNSHLDQEHKNNFYMEREWMKYGNLKFCPEEVQTIIVANNEYKNRLENERPQYKGKVEIPPPDNS